MVGMTTMPEAALAREAELCYATVAVITDYDVWRGSDEAVSAEAVMETMAASVRAAQDLIREAVPALAARKSCACRDALATAFATSPDAMDPQVADLLEPIVGRYVRSEP